MDWSISEDWSDELRLFAPGDSDVYFTPEYLRMHVDQDAVAECFIARDGDRAYLLPYMRRPVRILDDGSFDLESAYGYGGPIANTDDRAFARAAFDLFCDVQRERGGIACFTRFHPLLDNVSLVSERCQVQFDRHTVAMDLTLDEEQIWKTEVHPKHRTAIRRAKDAGLSVAVDREMARLGEFIELYECTMRAVGASPFYFFPTSYYESLRDTLGDHAFLANVMLEDRVVAGALFMHYGDYGHYHLSGSIRDYLGTNPNTFLLYEISRMFKEQGIRYFHLGGGSDTTEDNSLLRFKRRFAARTCDFWIGKAILDARSYDRACDRWHREYGESMGMYSHYFLKYRQIG